MSLAVQTVTCTRSGEILFAPVSFDLAPGEALLLRGPNGAGKTTLLRALAGLMPFHEGRATLDGTDTRQAAGRLAYAGHQDAIKPGLSVAENLAFWAAVHGRAQARDAIDRFGLAPLRDRLAGRLSAGQRRRLGLARLLLTGATLWLLDEPTNSLDRENAARLTGLIRDHLSQGGMAVIATHTDLDLAARTLTLSPADRAIAATDPFLDGAMA